MAESESKSDLQEESLKGSSKSASLNGHSSIPKEEVKKMNHTENLENGESDCKSPQVNGEISDKSLLDNCELPKTDNDSCELPKSEKDSELPVSDSVCITKDSNKELNESDNISQNGEVNSCTDIDSKTLASDSNDSVNKINSSETNISNNNSSSSIKTEIVEQDERSNDEGTKKSEEESDNVQSIEKDETKSDNQTKEKMKEEKSTDDNEDESEKSEEKSKTESEKEKESSEVTEKDGENKEAVKSEDSDDKSKQSETPAVEGDKKDTSAEEVKKDTTPVKEKKTPKKKKEINVEIVKRVTRSSSGITKPVKYVDPDPRDIIDDDDDIRITKEVKKNEESDIEMIEESDPLAISESDVKKAKETHKGTTFQERLKSIKQREPLHKGGSGKDNSNVIIIDTNTLIKGQGGVSTQPTHPSHPPTHHNSAQSKVTSNVSAQTTASNATTNIQTAIQTITGGNPAMQGLQSAYLNAIQQVLVAQGGSSVSNPHYIATLQQYYNTLGALQDDAYVIEAPSFIVPYVMEGKPVESIRDYLDRIKKEHQEEEEKRRKEEEKRKMEEEKKKKEEEELEKKKKEEKKNEEKEESEIKEVGEDDNMEIMDEEIKMEVDERIEWEEEKENSSEDVKKKKEAEKDKEVGEKEKDDKKDKEDEKMEVDCEIKEEKKDADEPEVKEVEKESKEIKEEEIKEVASGDNKENKKDEKDKPKEEEVIELDKEDKEDLSHLGRWEGYYKSALGKFFLELGLNHTQEFIQADLLKMQKRRVEKLKTNPTKQDLIAIKSLERQLNVSKEKNKPFYLQMKTCKFCSYKTESDLVMERHLESPHMVNYTYKCNFCEFETRGPQVILFHTEAEHNVRGRLERAPAFFQCPLCPFEDNNKSKMTRHSFSCAKKFKAEKNCDLSDWEPPAKIPKIHRGRPNVSAFGKAFDGLKMQNILPKNLGGLNINLQNAINSSLLNSAANVSANSIAGRGRGRPVGSYKNITQNIGNRSGSLVYQSRNPGLLQPMQGVTSAQQLSIANQVLQSVTQGGSNRVPRIIPAASAGSLLPGLAASSSITIQSVQNKSGNTKAPQQPSISITPLPRGGSQSSGNKSSTTTVPSAGNSQRPAFVICEICDGYIKDLEQLRNHMNLIHKVKIHPKMIYNRPPLNCQKCQHRFFTDQGLERHLLGTHGLVTSSMQEAANKGKDAGRCPICGKVFQWKLLNHVSRDHKMTLKPAHLSYKCTVCTATFNMYRLFENHVYSAHSVVNKNKSNESGGNSTTSSSTSVPAKKTVAGSETPLKINDEITIIPQPAAKSPKTESSKSSPKKDSPSVSKEITITKVGSRSSSRRSGSSSSSSNNNGSSSGGGGGGGGGVEVISLDDSPQKRQAEEPPKKRTRETATSKRARTSS